MSALEANRTRRDDANDVNDPNRTLERTGCGQPCTSDRGLPSVVRLLQGFSKSLLVRRGELRRIDLDCQLVELGGQLERNLVVLVIHRRTGISADVEGLIPLHDERDGAVHFLGCHGFTVDFQNTASAVTEAAEVVKGKGSEPQSIILEVELDHVFAWGKLGAFPAHSLKVEKIPSKYWLVFQNIEAVATEPAAVGMDHAFGAALRNFDLGCDRVVAVEHLGSIPMRDSGDRLAGVSENVPSSGDIRPRRNKARRRRCIQRQHLIFGEFYPQEVLHFLELGCVLCRDI